MQAHGCDLIFRNARVVDGSGNPWYRADVGVANGRIAGVAPGLDLPARRIVDAGGQILAPGFVDMHTHSDVMLLAEPRHEPKVFQGVTVELLGQDGLSYAPASPVALGQIRRHLAGLNGDAPEAGWDWTSVSSYLDRFDRRVAVNVAFLVPHNAVRIDAMGWERRLPSPAELDRMRGLVAEGMQEGARGFSTGLTYPPNVWSDTTELVALCEVVARYGGIYVTHMRGHGDRLLDPIRESIDVCRRAGLPLHISHLKGARLGSRRNVQGAIALIDEARASGLDVTFDSYQYAAGSSMLHSQLPDWMHEGGPEAELARLRSDATRALLRHEWSQQPPPWSRLTVASVRTPGRRWMEGRTLDRLIADSGRDPADFVCDLLLDEELAVSHVSEGAANEDDMRALLRHPAQMAGSDGLLLGGRAHPRTFGTFARVLQRYVREEGVLRLEEAIRKFSSLPAQRLGLADRGVVKEGMMADLVVFDERTVRENATPDEPRLLASGVSYLTVNGVLVLDAGRHTTATPGRALRRCSLDRG
jgi:N-acyl-D-amino-acid deacylase